jgi:hypothetical protein
MVGRPEASRAFEEGLRKLVAGTMSIGKFLSWEGRGEQACRGTP